MSATQITLGNMFTSNGKTVLTGGASGIDVESMVNSLAEAKRQPAVKLETKLETNAKKVTAYTEFQTLLDSFHDAANFLRNPPGVQNDAENIFNYRSASIGSSSSTSGSTYINVTAEAGTNLASYNISDVKLATKNIKTTATFPLADTATSAVGGTGPLNAGTMVLGPNGTTITLTAGDTLGQVVSKINAVSEESGIEATAVKISDGNYRISFQSTSTGSDMNYDISTPNAGIFNVAFAYSQDAVDSSMTLNGTTVTRSTNSVDDLIDGLTFDLKQASPLGTTLSVDIEADAELAKTGIMNFVDAYNALKLYASRQQELGDDGKPVDTAVLANDSTLRLSMSRLTTEMSSIVEGLSASNLNRLADIGITFSDYPGDDTSPFTRNILTVDEEKLTSSLTSNYDDVRQIFEFDYTSDNPDLQVFSRTNGLEVSDVAININNTSSTYTATFTTGSTTKTVTLTKETLSGGSIVLKGQEGTELDGLVLIYSDTANTTVNLKLSQGVADRVYNALDDLADEETGAVSVAMSALTEDDTRYNEEITKIDNMIERFRQQLLEKFAALEKAISSANSILQSIDANVSASNNN